MTVIGITGPTGAGKTTALEVLRDMGAEVVDCDALYYDLLRRDEPLRQALRDAFGEIFLPDGELDRRKLGTLVFGDPAALARLNAIVYPAMGAAVGALLAASPAAVGVVDAINLMESGLGARCDWTVAITAPREVRLRRIMARDHIDEAYAARRIDAQKPDSYYRKHCTFLLENRADSREDFRHLAEEFFAGLLEIARETD